MAKKNMRLFFMYFHSILDTSAGAGSAECVEAAGAEAGHMSVVVVARNRQPMQRGTGPWAWIGQVLTGRARLDGRVL